MCFLSSYEHLKFDLDRVQISMPKWGKWLILIYFFEKRSEIVNGGGLSSKIKQRQLGNQRHSDWLRLALLDFRVTYI